jgi:hypothetical protein
MDTFASYEIEVSCQKKKKHQVQKENKVMNETNKIGLNCNIKKNVIFDFNKSTIYYTLTLLSALK